MKREKKSTKGVAVEKTFEATESTMTGGDAEKDPEMERDVWERVKAVMEAEDAAAGSIAVAIRSRPLNSREKKLDAKVGVWSGQAALWPCESGSVSGRTSRWTGG